MRGAGQPGFRCRPRGDEFPFGDAEPHDVADPVEFAGREAGQDFDGGAFDESLGFGPVLFGG